MTAAPPKQKYVPRKQFISQNRAAAALSSRVQFLDYAPRGASRELFRRRDPELIVDGPAGTGKSRGCLEKAHWMLEKYKNIRGIMIRKTRRSLTQTAMITYQYKVLPNPQYVPFHGGDQEYRYRNGSIFAVAGIDDPKKIYSSEWDFAYINQAEELDEGEWEDISARIRNWKMPYQQMFADVNPAEPTHWIRGRASRGFLALLDSKHEDNPELWDVAKQDWTERGRDYIARLDRLTGVRYKRLRLGLWAGAEGIVYEESWSRADNVIDRFFTTTDLTEDQVPEDWPRYWTIDFGYTNPFVWQAWAKDPDGRMFRYKEIYKTKVLVEDHARRILEVTKNEPKPVAILCDHDAEDRATLERHLGLKTKAAWKSVGAGIQAVESRMRKAGDGKPRLFYLRDSLIELDQELTLNHMPTCTEDEIESYIWDRSAGKKKGDQPVKENDHGCDATRYGVTFVDKTWEIKPDFFPMISVVKGDSSSGSDMTQGSSWRMGNSFAPSRWGGQNGGDY